MNKSWKAHYLNKYPGGRVSMDEDRLDVYDKEGAHVVALRKNGAGMMVCQSEEHGCENGHGHDLSPLPAESKAYEHKDGSILKVKGFDEGAVAHLMDGNEVLSIEELKEQGKKFDFEGKVSGKA